MFFSDDSEEAGEEGQEQETQGRTSLPGGHIRDPPGAPPAPASLMGTFCTRSG